MTKKDHNSRATNGFSREAIEMLLRVKQETADHLKSIAESADLKGAIAEYIATLTGESEGLAQIAAGIRRGRPAKPDLNRLVGDRLKGKFRWVAIIPPSRKPGRPLSVPISDDELVRALADARLAGPPRSERAVLEDLARQMLLRSGKHGAGNQARRMAANMQKRVAAIRAKRVPKPPT